MSVNYNEGCGNLRSGGVRMVLFGARDLVEENRDLILRCFFFFWLGSGNVISLIYFFFAKGEFVGSDFFEIFVMFSMRVGMRWREDLVG